MPGIPTYDRGAGIDTLRQVVPHASGADPIAQGLEGISRGMGQLDANLQRQQAESERQDAIRKHAEDKQAEERAKAWSGQQAGQSALTESQTLQDAQRKAAPGADGFAKDYLEGFDKRAADILAAAPDERSKQYVQQHLQAQRTHFGTTAQAFQFQAGDADAVNRYTSAVDTWGKVVLQDPSQFGVANKTLAQTMPDLLPASKERVTTHATATLTNAAAAHWLDKDPYQVQEATSKAMGDKGFTGPTGVPWVDAATPEQVRTWNNQAATKVKMIESQLGRETQAREKTAQESFNSATDLSFKGQFFDAPFQTKLLADTKGTRWEAAASELIASQKHTAGFASGPATDRAAVLDTMRSRGADPAQGTNPAMAAELGKFEGIDNAIRAAIKENPWKAGTQYGALKSAPVAQIGSVDDALKVIDGRAAAQGPLEVWTGKNESPLQPEEADQFSTMVRRMPPKQAASALGQIGAAVGNSDRAAAIAKQIKDKDGTLAAAMAYANMQTNEGRYASELVLTGEQVVKDGTLKGAGIKLEDLKQQVALAVRGAYANREVEDQVIHSATLIAVAKGGDVANAVHLATGGGIIDFNGSKVPMPPGFHAGGQSAAEDRFRKSVAELPIEQLMPQIPDGKVYSNGTPIAASDFYRGLKDAQLLMRGRSRNGAGNVYGVKAGNGLVTNAQGQPILIEIK